MSRTLAGCARAFGKASEAPPRPTSQPVWQNAAAWVRKAAQASAAYARAPPRGVLTPARAHCACALAQEVLGVSLLALGAAREFRALKSSLKALETRVTELGTRMTEGSAALCTRLEDTNSRLAALDASVNTLVIDTQGVQSALLQLVAAERAQPARTLLPHAAAARLSQDDAQQ